MSDYKTEQITVAEAINRFEIEFDYGPSKNTKNAYSFALRIFKKYITSEKNIKDLLLTDLDLRTCRTYELWLAEEIEKNKPRYAEKSRVLCKTVLDRFINYWRNQNQISFSLVQEKEHDQVSRVHSKKKDKLSSTAKIVDEDFGDRMLKAAYEYYEDQLEYSRQVRSKRKARFIRMNALRALALVSVLRATGLRISDTLLLQKSQIEAASLRNGYLEVDMVKTGDKAHVVFNPETLKIISDYLAERADNSPWIFIQHGRGGWRKRKVNDQFYTESDNHTGYGMRLGPYSGRSIIETIALKAGYTLVEKKDPEGNRLPLRKGESGQYITPHAFRHWHAQTLKKMGMPIEEIQSVLGHASPDTTKKIYAPIPDLKKIHDFEMRLQEKPQSEETEEKD